MRGNADNRITEVETSADAQNWHHDARYFYYPHGPLQRVELGEHLVQGTDYAYTLQGWLKGINGDRLNPTTDMGRDGDATVVGNPKPTQGVSGLRRVSRGTRGPCLRQTGLRLEAVIV